MTDSERIAELERRVDELNRKLFDFASGSPVTFTLNYQTALLNPVGSTFLSGPPTAPWSFDVGYNVFGTRR